MGTIQSDMLARATKLRDDNTHEVASIEDFEKAIDGGWAIAYWDGTDETDLAIKEREELRVRLIKETRGGAARAIGRVVLQMSMGDMAEEGEVDEGKSPSHASSRPMGCRPFGEESHVFRP